MARHVQDHLGNTYQSVKAMCEKYDISSSTYQNRVHQLGWTVEKALTAPVRPRGKSMPKKAASECGAFSPESNYPAREYVRYLKHRLAVMETEIQSGKRFLLDYIKTIKAYDKALYQINNEQYHFHVMDMIFNGEDVTKYCQKSMRELCTYLLDNPTDGIIEEIYITFANGFNLQRLSVNNSG